MAEKLKWYSRPYMQEVIVFVAMFALTMLHEWFRIDTMAGFIKGLAFFSVLYAQARAHQIFIFPLFLRRRYGLYALAAAAFTLAGALLLHSTEALWIDTEFSGDLDQATSILYNFVTCTVSTVMIMSFFLIRSYSLELERGNQRQLLLSEMNIRFLHAQLSPHFFFNMFNNLYGVSLTDPKKVPELILDLSRLMRYQLENGNRSTVSIGEEIGFIKNYIAMEKVRIGKRCDISFSFPDDAPLLESCHIAPLILITLVENAFKHSLTIKSQWFVYIDIEIDGSRLKVEIRNSLPDDSLQNESTGIGLANIRQRLELLYGTDYLFTASPDGNEYRTSLSLKLKILR